MLQTQHWSPGLGLLKQEQKRLGPWKQKLKRLGPRKQKLKQ